MVQIAPLFQMINAAAQAASLQNEAASNELVARQGVDPNAIPAQCQSSCQVLSTITNCGTSTTCMCASSVGTNLEACMTCFVNLSSDPAVAEVVVQAIGGWNVACNGQLAIPTATGTASGSSPTGTAPATPASTSSAGGSTPSSGPHNGAVGLKTVSVGVVCIAAAAFGAFMAL